MKTTDRKAKAYIATLTRETLERFAFDAFCSLNKDRGEWLDSEDDFPSGADVCEDLDGALSDAKISIEQIEAYKAPAVMPAGPGSLTIYNSKRDRAGNCYFAINYNDHRSGKTVTATVEGGSNARAAVFHLNGGTWDPQPKGERRTIIVCESELGIREFERMVKGWPHFGAVPQEIAEKIRAAIAAPAAQEAAR